MSNEERQPNHALELRQAAEEELARSKRPLALTPGKGTEDLLHELQVHQIELEMQNEELRRAQEELEESRNKYKDLWDFAPVSCFTFNCHGRITEANLTGASLLGVYLHELIHHGFGQFVAPEEISRWDLHRLEALGQEGVVNCDLTLIRKGGLPFFAQLHSTRTILEDGSPALRTTVVDITESKRAKDVLKAAETDHRVLFDRVPSSLYRSTPDGQFLAMNQALVDLLGYTSVQELMNVNIAHLFYRSPEERRQWVDKLLRIGEFRNVEIRVLRKDGSPLVLLENSHVVRDEAGGVLFFEGSLTDITDLKRVEEALRESEVLQRILLDNLPAGVVIVDPVTRVIERVNDHVASLFGAPVEHLVGQRCHLLLCPTCEGACPVCDMGQDVDNSDRVMLRMDGSRLPILKTVKRIQLNGQEKLLECFVDVSERKQAEEVLRESEEWYHQLFESASDALFLSASDTGLIVEANTVASELYGYNRDELLTKKSTDLSAEPEETERRIQEAQTAPDQVIRIPLRLHRKKDGTVFPVEITARPLFVKGRRFLLVAARDITERKELEERIRQVRSDLLFAVSHDLKSPIQTLRQTQEMLGQLPPAEALARFQEYSEIWRRSLQRLERMINNLVDSQRGEEGRFPLLLAPCDPVELVKRVTEDLTGYALSSQVTFNLKLQPAPEGSCDEEALSRVVENLLINAVKFSPKGGKVEVRIALEDQTLLLEVEDHGLGIPTQEQAQLFQPFQRGRSAQQKRIPGTGLGLYVCRRIIEEHNGSVSLTSEEGKGTTVIVRLPWRDAGRKRP